MLKDRIISFYSSLRCPEVPDQYACMNPYAVPETMNIVRTFAEKFYGDDFERRLVFGINPGRFGSGITGISFTDPIRLKEVLGIDHHFEMKAELSSEFVYDVVTAYGGPEVFFSKFFVSAVYPLGFLHKGKNLNYYELPRWKDYMPELISRTIESQLEWRVDRSSCICIGRGQNVQVLRSLNESRGWFNEIVELPHPRWIMQYNRRRKDAFVDDYLNALI